MTTLSMFQVTQPNLLRGLHVLTTYLVKMEAFLADSTMTESELLAARLADDMFPLTKQIQIATDTAKGAMARLSGTTAPTFEDNETTIAQLKERVAKTITYLESIKPADIDGTEDKEITISSAKFTAHFSGEGYVFGFMLPNFYFHVATVHAILRKEGITVGKYDYLGQMPLRSAPEVKA